MSRWRSRLPAGSSGSHVPLSGAGAGLGGVSAAVDVWLTGVGSAVAAGVVAVAGAVLVVMTVTDRGYPSMVGTPGGIVAVAGPQIGGCDVLPDASAVAEAARLVTPGGLLLIADFAPHDHEFLREVHQHRRLGFDDVEIVTWLQASGLALESNIALPPATGEGLTVKIWTGQRTDAPAAA